MSWSDKDIDKLFSENAHPEVPFQESYWAEMEAMLPPTPPAKKPFAWFKFSLGVAASTLIIVALYNLPQNSESSAYSRTSNIHGEISGNKKMNNIFANHIKTAAQNNKLIKETEIEVDTPENDKNHKLNNSGKGLSHKDVISKGGQYFSIGNKNENSKGGFVKGEIVIAENNPDNINNISIDNSNYLYNRLTTNKINTLDTKEINFNTEFPSIALLNDVEFVKIPSRLTYFVDVYGGIGQSLIANGNTLTTNFGAAVGVNKQYGRYILGAGLGFVGVRYNNFKFDEKSTYYSFTKTTYRNNFNYQYLYNFQIPLQLARVTKFGTIELNIAPGYTFQSQLDYEFYENESIVRRNQVYGETRGYNKFSLQTGLGYRIPICGSWEFGVRVQAEICQTVKSQAEYLDKKHFPINGQIVLRKKLGF